MTSEDWKSLERLPGEEELSLASGAGAGAGATGEEVTKSKPGAPYSDWGLWKTRKQGDDFISHVGQAIKSITVGYKCTLRNMLQ